MVGQVYSRSRKIGMTPIKLNAVINRDTNHDEVLELFEFAKQSYTTRFHSKMFVVKMGAFL